VCAAGFGVVRHTLAIEHMGGSSAAPTLKNE
jgi:hypothetical protein